MPTTPSGWTDSGLTLVLLVVIVTPVVILASWRDFDDDLPERSAPLLPERTNPMLPERTNPMLPEPSKGLRQALSGALRQALSGALRQALS